MFDSFATRIVGPSKSSPWKIAMVMAVGASFSGVAPGIAMATIDNVVTATATIPGGVPNGVTATDTESVDVQDAAPALSIVKDANLNDEIVNDGFAEVGETTTYTYRVTNSGNVTLTNVAVQDIHEGVILSPPPAGEIISITGPNLTSDVGVANDGVVDVLDVGAEATFTITLTVTQEEVDNQ
ncbi:MAG: hypothetical protein QNJ29_03645 [Rhizobiaceae bacterium]|nr:hypothetical protein [Rhizobiaceae bacterium]